MGSDIFSETLITGADGMVGSYIDFGIKTDRQSLDVTDPGEVIAAFKKHRPKVVIHLASETDVDRCERESERAYFVNSVGTYHVASAAKEIGAKLIYISTADVFDGKKKSPYNENDEPNPQSFYGRSKYLGELAVRGLLENHLILRVCWMMGGGPGKDKKFVAKIIEQLGNKEIFALDDHFGSPTFAKDLVHAIRILIKEDKKGLYHMANSGVASRCEMAKFIFDFLGGRANIQAVKSDFFKLPAARPKNGGLTSKLNLMRPWQEGLKEYLETEWKAS